jgi:hypothetical protein
MNLISGYPEILLLTGPVSSVSEINYNKKDWGIDCNSLKPLILLRSGKKMVSREGIEPPTR